MRVDAQGHASGIAQDLSEDESVADQDDQQPAGQPVHGYEHSPGDPD
jgi:hypothetical protein